MNKAKIYIAPDHMSAVLQRVGPEAVGCSSAEEVRAEAVKLRIVFGLDLGMVDAWLESGNEEDLVIAKGVYAKNGRDAYIKFHVDISAKPQFVPEPAQEGGAIDFKNAMRVSLVKADERIAEYIPPTPGEPGTNVLGGNMSPVPGNSTRVGIGEGITQKGNDYLATTSGTPSFKENIIAVKRMYEVNENVSFATGNINFPGTVVIRGDILDGFEVNAQEHVIVQGIVNAAKITAGGYIQCLGGVLGKGKAEIRASSFIEVRHADSAFLISDGDITITKDVLHCKTQSLGMVRCGGVIIGGEVMAMKGIECQELGSEIGTKTLAFIRKHYRQEKAKELAAELLEEANEINERFKRYQQAGALNPEDLVALDSDVKTVQGLVQKKKNLDNQIEKFDRLIGEQRGAVISVKKMLWTDVVLGAPYCKYTPVEKTGGPITISEDVAHGSMNVVHG